MSFVYNEFNCGVFPALVEAIHITNKAHHQHTILFPKHISGLMINADRIINIIAGISELH